MEDIIAEIQTWQASNPAFARTTVQTSLQHLASEVGELASALGESPYSCVAQVVRGGQKKRGQPGSEIADVAFMLVDLCRRLNIDLLAVMRETLQRNIKRTYVTSVGGIVEHKK